LAGNDARLRRMRVRAAWIILFVSLVCWPLCAWWVWAYMGKFSPFEQLMLLLSFAAIWLVSADLLTTAQVHEEAGQQEEGGTSRDGGS
jgi:hypothetical protein